MDLIKIVGSMIELREDLKDAAREMEWKAKKLDRAIDELMENLKHRGLVETRRIPEKRVPVGKEGKETHT